MSSKFIHRLKKRLLIPTLTMLVIVSQIAPLTASAATNNDIMDLINSSGTEISIVIDEDAVAAPVKSNRGKHTSSNSNDNVTVGGTYKSSNKKGGYSSDGRTNTKDGVAYLSTKSLAEANASLKADLDDYFGEKNLFSTGYQTNNVSVWKGEKASLWDTIVEPNSPILKALKSKTQRLELGKIAVENKLISKNNYASSHLVGLFTYMGIINRDDGLTDYSNSNKAYVTREQGALMLGRFMHPDAFFEAKEGSYTKYTDYYDKDMMVGDGSKGVTDTELSSSMTRLEFMYMLTDAYFPDDVEAAEDTEKTSASIFTDIDKGDVLSIKAFYGKYKLLDSSKASGKVDGADNTAGRKAIKYKEISKEMDAHVEAAYKLGILTKDSKGKANLFKNITYKEALVMLTNAGLAQADGKSIN